MTCLLGHSRLVALCSSALSEGVNGTREIFATNIK